jgi:hypothetical protein
MLINRAFARRFFPDRTPLGEPIAIGGVGWEVIGIVDDIRARAIDVEPDPQAYVDFEGLADAGRIWGGIASMSMRRRPL